MAESGNLEKLEGILNTFADLIREGEGHNNPVAVSDMKQKIVQIDIAKFVNQTELGKNDYTIVNGSTDSSSYTDTLDYFRHLLTNFADKVREGKMSLQLMI